jgi:hypothetical protein
MLKKIVLCAVIVSLTLSQGALIAQNKATGATASKDEEVTRDDRIPVLMKRLLAGIKSLKIEPDKDNRYIFTIKSGYQYDMLERQHLMVYRKAYLYMSGDSIAKIVFEYYQFSMDSKVRDVKTFTNTTPESADLGKLLVDYSSNTGEKQKYTAADIQKRESRRSVITQYVNYLISLVYNIELYKHKTIRVETVNIERTIQLGE